MVSFTTKTWFGWVTMINRCFLVSFYYFPFKHQPKKMVKHTQTSCSRQIVWVCLSILLGWRLEGWFKAWFLLLELISEIVISINQKQLPGGFLKKSVLKNFTKFTWKHPFSCEFCEIFKNSFFTEHLRATASGHKKGILVWNEFNVL